MSQMNFLEQLMQERRALSVSELTARIKILVEGEFAEVWVEGEVSNFRRHSSGHWYFTLKDEGAMLRCASFRMQNRLIRFTPEDGLTVRAHGRLSLYEVRGEYQLLVEYLEPVGVGALQLAFEQLKRQLAAEGLFDIERKRQLPALPRCIGVVTSPTGAAIRDILRIIKRRNEAVSVLIAPARVQGDGAGAEIARAIRALNLRDEVDVIIVGRGGGSIEDLWCFNEECVARAIYESRVPVISAVGHETDFTIADFVADLRASTPSAAAEMVAMARDEIAARIAGLTEDLANAMRYRLIEHRSRLAELESSRAFDEVEMAIHATAQRFDEAAHRMELALGAAFKARRADLAAVMLRLREADIRRAMTGQRGRLEVLSERLESFARATINNQREKFSVAVAKLESLSPLAVLGRGYAIAFDSEGRVIKRATDVGAGSRIRVRVAEGEIECEKI
ncbi:MAG TPA: exodeoxyribonuclease VII large subunit [Blastocatellia bacterium]|nr:exodeoxyribonuclease VII large subunit [Blastocatellia bacterium]